MIKIAVVVSSTVIIVIKEEIRRLHQGNEHDDITNKVEAIITIFHQNLIEAVGDIVTDISHYLEIDKIRRRGVFIIFIDRL